jgi:short-subunit dehydrogenase
MKIRNITLYYILIHTVIILIKFVLQSRKFTMQEKNLIKIYGEKTWIVITGASSGQGKCFALEFAAKGFNILMIGSEGCIDVQTIINKKFPTVQTEVIIKDFSLSYEGDFFDSIEESISNKDVCGLISNIGKRFAFKPYHKTPKDIITQVISAKAITQCHMIKIAITAFLKRQQKSFIIVISALCVHEPSIFHNSPNTVPFMSIYEATNAFSYFHAASIYEELKTNPLYIKINFINITPAAVITKNTKIFLKDAPFSVKDYDFVKSIIKLIGNFDGTTCGCFEHMFSTFIPSLIPLFNMKKKILHKTGSNIANFYKNPKD